jgi:hypothetical protein
MTKENNKYEKYHMRIMEYELLDITHPDFHLFFRYKNEVALEVKLIYIQ